MAGCHHRPPVTNAPPPPAIQQPQQPAPRPQGIPKTAATQQRLASFDAGRCHAAQCGLG